MSNKWSVCIKSILTLILAGVLASSALAGKFHFNNLDFNLGGSLVLEGSLVGLGKPGRTGRVDRFTGAFGRCAKIKEASRRQEGNPIFVEVQQSGVYVSENNGRALVRVVAPDPTEPEIRTLTHPKASRVSEWEIGWWWVSWDDFHRLDCGQGGGEG
jgi:hypothetical protein